jgi:hypothetical protein
MAVYHAMGSTDLAAMDTLNVPDHAQALIREGLTAGDTDGADRSEAVVEIEGETYLTEYTVADELQTVIESGHAPDKRRPTPGERPSEVYRLR